LPEPPAPVSVNSLVEASLRSTSAISRSRPTKLLLGAGRLCLGVPGGLCVLRVLKEYPIR
jgi:hypothetical protein